MNHSIIIEIAIISRTIFKGEHTLAVLEVLFPLSFILASIRVVERALAMSLAELPVADVSVSKELAVG